MLKKRISGDAGEGTARGRHAPLKKKPKKEVGVGYQYICSIKGSICIDPSPTWRFFPRQAHDVKVTTQYHKCNTMVIPM
jgi:hypothetical protein